MKLSKQKQLQSIEENQVRALELLLENGQVKICTEGDMSSDIGDASAPGYCSFRSADNMSKIKDVVAFYTNMTLLVLEK